MKALKILILTLILGTTGLYAQHSDKGHGPMTESKIQKKYVKSAKYLAVNQTMRKLWADHMYWTLATVDAYFNNPETVDLKLKRLLANQDEIGAAIVPFYGREAGNALTELLHGHINGAVPVLKAAKEDDKADLDVALRDWYKNAKEIAEFLSNANPDNWPPSATEPALKMHIDHTVDYSVNILKDDYKSAINGFEEALNHMLVLGDILTDGLAAQFPKQFK